MISLKTKKDYYQALVNKNVKYDGIFYAGIKTTGIFCRPTCTAKKPKFKHCEFFETPQEALLASYRPCKRCRPLSHPNEMSEIVQVLVAAVENNPAKRWKDNDFKKLSINATTASRQFKKRFGMTFVQFARARRMGLAMQQIREGKMVIDAQLSSGYESGSGFRDAFSRIMGSAPMHSDKRKILKASWIDTPLGPMLAVGDDEHLYVLEFIDRRGLEREIERLRMKTAAAIIPGKTDSIHLIDQELKQYFAGKLKDFKTPLFLLGSPFQQKVWKALMKIPYGKTWSYRKLAQSIGHPESFRAVANANGANQLAIIIPCHRVINSNGALGGYGGGIARKEWFLKHERKFL